MFFGLSGCNWVASLAKVNREAPFIVTLSSSQIYEGQQTSVEVHLRKIYPEAKTVSWRIEQDNGEMASASDFSILSGSFSLTGTDTQSFLLASIPGSLSSGSKTYRLVFSSEGVEKSFDLVVVDSGPNSTVAISQTDNSGHVNLLNQAIYTISGLCSSEGGSVLLTAEVSGQQISGSTTCNGLAWSIPLDLSSLADGAVTLNVTHTSISGNVGTATLQIQKDVLVPTVSIDSPAALSPINAASSSSFTFSGTCSETSESVNVVLSSSGGATTMNVSASCLAGGWSLTANVSSLADGTITAIASHADVAGNTASANRDFVKDTLAPNLTFSTPLDGVAINSTAVTATGTCETGVSIDISGAGVLSPTSGACSFGTFSLALTLVSGDGSKAITLSQTDAAGNISTQTHTLTLDTVLPVLNFTSGAVQSQITNTNAVTFTGACETGVTIQVSVTDTASTPCTAGTWSYTTATQTTDDSRGYTFTQTDAAGNSTSISGTWLRDATVPVVSLSSLTGGQYVKGSSIQAITWTASDANFGASPISLDYSTDNGGTWTSIASNLANSGTYSWAVPALNAANVKVRVTAQDAVNTAVSASTTVFVIDSSNPVVTLTSLNGGQILKGGGTTNITWTASDANLTATPISLDYTSDGSTWTSIATGLTNSGSYAWTVPSLDGATFKVRVTALDQVANTASATSTAPFTIDSTIPSVTLTSLTGGQTISGNGASHAITWSVSDANMTSTPISLSYSSDSGLSWTSIASGLTNSGTYSWTVSVADGTTYRVKLTATDSAGNIGSAISASDFTVTSQAPNITQTTITSPYVSNSATTITFGGVCDLSASMVDSTVTISGDQSATTSCNGTAPSGTWSWTTSSQSTDGVRNYTFSQTNSYAITSDVSAAWIRDTVAPQVTAVSVNNGDMYLQTTIGSISVTASDAAYSTGLKVRVATAAGSAADCQTLYADNSWQDQINSTMAWVSSFPDGGGVKKACAWAKDAAGNVSLISPSTGTLGVDMNTIKFSDSSPPQIASFTVENSADGSQTYSAGDLVKISWSVTDDLGLDNNPIKLEYTTDNITWTTFEAGYGSLSGNPTSYNYTYYGFNAPSAGYFRIRIKATNMTGQDSIAIVSPSQNTDKWLVYAGSTDRGVGGSARSALFLKTAGSLNKHFAFNPVNGDLYVDDHSSDGGIVKIDARTGVVSKFIPYGTTNLPADGTMPASPLFMGSETLITFDRSNRMYLMQVSTSRTVTSSIIYQIDLTTNHVRKYLGSASAVLYDNTATPSTVFVQGSDFTFDESNTMYFTTSCLAGTTWDGSHVNLRLMKVTQNPDGTPGTVSVVAGDCTQASPVSGSVATATGLSSNGDGLYSSLIAWNNGDVIYYSDPSQGAYKILNGIIYSTAIPKSHSMIYSASLNKIYGTDTSYKNILEYSVDTSGAGGEVNTGTVATSGGTVGCNDEGVSASATCMNFYGGLIFDPQGKLYFEIGSANAPARLGYVNSTGKISIMAGTLPFYGDTLNKGVARGTFTGIYYKQASELNQSAFPAGLYFTEQYGPVFGFMNDSTGQVTVLAGNQTSIGNAEWGNGVALSKDLSMGMSGYVYARKMTFDNQGLPWLTYYASGAGAILTSVDASGNIVRRQNGTTLWDLASTSVNPANTQMSFYGAESNLTLKNSSLFLLGSTVYSVTYQHTDPVMRIFDFANSVITQIMGNGGTTSSADTTVPGSLAGLDLDGICVNQGCKMQFIENDPAQTSDDLLYFSEGKKFRVISDPSTPANNLLTTIFTASSNISNFILSTDQSQLFYTMNGHLYCYPLTGAGNKSWCNSTNLGPTSGMNVINTGPNQFTWKDSQTLLISNYHGEIYQYTLPQIP